MTDFQEQSPIKQLSRNELPSGPYEALNLDAFIGSQREKIISVEEQVQAALAEEREELRKKVVGLENKMKEVSESLLVLENIKSSFEMERKEWWSKVQKEMNEIVLYVSEKVIDEEVKTNPEIIKKCIEKVIDQADEKGRKVLLLNLTDYETLKKMDETIIPRIEKMKSFDIKPSDDLPPGSCCLDTSSVRLESSISKRVDFLWSELSPSLPAREIIEKNQSPSPESAKAAETGKIIDTDNLDE